MYKYVYVFETVGSNSLLELLRMQKQLVKLITLSYSGSKTNPYLWYIQNYADVKYSMFSTN